MLPETRGQSSRRDMVSWNTTLWWPALYLYRNILEPKLGRFPYDTTPSARFALGHKLQSTKNENKKNIYCRISEHRDFFFNNQLKTTYRRPFANRPLRTFFRRTRSRNYFLTTATRRFFSWFPVFVYTTRLPALNAWPAGFRTLQIKVRVRYTICIYSGENRGNRCILYRAVTHTVSGKVKGSNPPP